MVTRINGVILNNATPCGSRVKTTKPPRGYKIAKQTPNIHKRKKNFVQEKETKKEEENEVFVIEIDKPKEDASFSDIGIYVLKTNQGQWLSSNTIVEKAILQGFSLITRGRPSAIMGSALSREAKKTESKIFTRKDADGKMLYLLED